MIGKPHSAKKGYFVQRSSILNQTSDDLKTDLKKMNMTHYLDKGGEGKTGKMHSCVREMYKNSFMEEVR